MTYTNDAALNAAITRLVAAAKAEGAKAERERIVGEVYGVYEVTDMTSEILHELLTAIERGEAGDK